MIIVDRESGSKTKRTGGCISRDSRIPSVKIIAAKYGFDVVRSVCYPLRPMSKSEFNKLIYQNYAPNEVVVVFKVFGGVEHNSYAERIEVSDVKCERWRYMKPFPLSPGLQHDALVYKEKFMPKAGKGYISVMIRLEHFSINHNRFKGQSSESILRTLQTLYKSVVGKVSSLKAKHKVDEVFLTADCNKHGSQYFSDNINNVMRVMSGSIGILYKMLYGNSSTWEEREESFDTVSSFRNPGYIAMLQKHLAASGTCLITAGGGVFQRTARIMYDQYHPGSGCTFII